MGKLLSRPCSSARRNDCYWRHVSSEILDRQYFLRSTIVWLAVAALSGLVCYAKPLEVVNKGRTDFVIVKGSDAAAPEQFAAQELQKYIRAYFRGRAPDRKRRQEPEENFDWTGCGDSRSTQR